jgi:hypothetical protein
VLKISFLPSILKVNDKNSPIRIQDPDPDHKPDPDHNPDPLVRGMDPRIRIIHKILWIRNTSRQVYQGYYARPKNFSLKRNNFSLFLNMIRNKHFGSGFELEMFTLIESGTKSETHICRILI